MSHFHLFACRLLSVGCLFLGVAASLAGSMLSRSGPQRSLTAPLTIVLPARVSAGQPATLAVLGGDGKLATDIIVDLQNTQRVKTDATGRAYFRVPVTGSVLFATAPGTSAVALIDSASLGNHEESLSVASAVSLREPFSICGGKFHGNADENRVRINDEPVLVMAASPACLSLLPGHQLNPGPAQIQIQSDEGHWRANTTLISLESELPDNVMSPGKKGRITVQVRGAAQQLRLFVTNKRPEIVRFLRGDTQELISSGGLQNSVSVEAQAIDSGDFTFDVKLLQPPDEISARRYLEAAVPLVPPNRRRQLKRPLKRLSHGAHSAEAVRRELDRLLASTTPGDLHTLLAAARETL